MRVIHVLRKPLSEGTVAANTLKHGTGGLNIDASRIAGEVPEVTGQGFRSGKYGGQIGWGEPTLSGVPSNPSSGGRWPANVILQHLDGCRYDGVKKVDSNDRPNHNNIPRSNTRNVYGDYQSGDTMRPQYGDNDGTETIANWICEPGCPVAGLDEQSGVIKGVVRQPTGKAVYPTDGAAMNWNSNSVIDNTVRGFGDTGGASRFFKQIGGSDE